VDWKKKQILDTWEESSESTDVDGIASFISCVWEWLRDKNVNIEVKSNGNGFHPEILDALTELKSEGVVMPKEDSPELQKMAEEILNSDGNNYKELIYKNLKTKVELMAEGYYGGKKRGPKSS
jgi:hypothetical protein